MLSSKYLFAIKCYPMIVNIHLPTHTHRKMSGRTSTKILIEIISGGWFVY